MIAIRPPAYFPGLAYWALMLHVDRFILADTVPYSRQSFQNRARLRNPTGTQWISVPLLGRHRGTAIAEVPIDTQAPWVGKHRRALAFNYRTTPYYEFYEDELEVFYVQPWTHLGPLTTTSIELTHRLLGMSTPLVKASALPGAPASLEAIFREAGNESLLALPDSLDRDVQIWGEVQPFVFTEPVYRQNFAGFEPGLSILDLLFNYGPETVRMLRGAGG